MNPGSVRSCPVSISTLTLIPARSGGSSDRQLLHHLDPVSGGVLRPLRREIRSRGWTDANRRGQPFAARDAAAEGRGAMTGTAPRFGGRLAASGLEAVSSRGGRGEIRDFRLRRPNLGRTFGLSDRALPA